MTKEQRSFIDSQISYYDKCGPKFFEMRDALRACLAQIDTAERTGIKKAVAYVRDVLILGVRHAHVAHALEQEFLREKPVTVQVPALNASGFCSKCGILRTDRDGVPVTDCICTAKQRHKEDCMYVKAVGMWVEVAQCEAHGKDACEECDCTCAWVRLEKEKT